MSLSSLDFGGTGWCPSCAPLCRGRARSGHAQQVSTGFGPHSLGSRILPGLYVMLMQVGADLCLINVKSHPPPALPVTNPWFL